MASTLNPQYTPTQQAWRDAVAITALRAKDTMGDAYHSRIDKAQALVLAGAVIMHDDGTATVQVRRNPTLSTLSTARASAATPRRRPRMAGASIVCRWRSTAARSSTASSS